MMHAPTRRRSALRLAGAVAVTAAMTLTACGADENESATAAGDSAAEGKQVSIKLLPHVKGLKSADLMAQGGEDAAKDVGNVTLSVDAPSTVDIPSQVKFFNQALTQDMDGVAAYIVVGDPWMRPSKDAAARKLPFVPVGLSTVPGVDHAAQFDYVAGINELVDQAVAEIKRTEGENASGTVGVVECVPGLPFFRSELEAVKAAFAERLPSVKVDGPLASDVEPTKNFSAWQSLVRTKSDYLAFFGICEGDGPSQAKIKASNPDAPYAMYNLNAFLPETLEGIEKGTIAAGVILPQYLEGYVGVRLAAEAAQKGESVPAGWRKLPVDIVSQQNVGTGWWRPGANLREEFAEYIDGVFADTSAGLAPVEEATG